MASSQPGAASLYRHLAVSVLGLLTSVAAAGPAPPPLAQGMVCVGIHQRGVRLAEPATVEIDTEVVGRLRNGEHACVAVGTGPHTLNIRIVGTMCTDCGELFPTWHAFEFDRSQSVDVQQDAMAAYRVRIQSPSAMRLKRVDAARVTRGSVLAVTEAPEPRDPTDLTDEARSLARYLTMPRGLGDPSTLDVFAVQTCLNRGFDSATLVDALDGLETLPGGTLRHALIAADLDCAGARWPTPKPVPEPPDGVPERDPLYALASMLQKRRQGAPPAASDLHALAACMESGHSRLEIMERLPPSSFPPGLADALTTAGFTCAAGPAPTTRTPHPDRRPLPR